MEIIFCKDAPYGFIILIYLTLHENDKKISCFSDFFSLSGYVKRYHFSQRQLYERGTFSLGWKSSV